MPFVSVTRLHLRSVRFAVPFVVYSLRSVEQLRRSPGFRRGWAGSEFPLGFWTVTTWESVEAMRTFRNGRPHLDAMKKMFEWADEGSFAHWEQADDDPPDPVTAFRRIAADGRISKVLHPSPRHAAGATAGNRPPRIGQRISGKAARRP